MNNSDISTDKTRIANLERLLADQKKLYEKQTADLEKANKDLEAANHQIKTSDQKQLFVDAGGNVKHFSRFSKACPDFFEGDEKVQESIKKDFSNFFITKQETPIINTSSSVEKNADNQPTVQVNKSGPSNHPTVNIIE